VLGTGAGDGDGAGDDVWKIYVITRLQNVFDYTIKHTRKRNKIKKLK
jgi:hypothetical protein